MRRTRKDSTLYGYPPHVVRPMSLFGPVAHLQPGMISQRPWFGTGADGDVVIAADTNLTSTLDGDAVVKNYRTLTIDATKTLTVSNRCKGLIIYVQGDCTINGTLTMTARGANAAAADKYDASKVFGSVDFGTTVLAGPSVAGVASDIVTLPQAGAAGATTKETSGNAGVNGQTGGGGSAGGSGNNWGRGSDGTAFSGGSGGAGGAASHGAPNGGAGGNGGPCRTRVGGSGGGAGNPGGAGGPGGCPFNGGPGGAGSTGTGGSLILLVGGNLTINSGVVIAANGTAGGNPGYGSDAGGDSGGGGSGGGSIIILYGRGYVNNGTVQANGGAGGAGGPYGSGFPGGAGSIQTVQVFL